MSHKHELQDLSVPMAKVEVEAELRKTSCKHHGKDLTHFCLTCQEKVCQVCQRDNTCGRKEQREHMIINILIKKRQLAQKLHLGSKVIHSCDLVATEINRKLELQPSVQDELTSSINNLFDRMLKIAEKRRNDLVQEAKKIILEAVSELHKKAEHVRKTKSSIEEYVQRGEVVINDMDDAATVNLFDQSKNFYKWLSERDKELTQGFDTFVEKNCHFQVDWSAREKIQSLLDTMKVAYGASPDQTRNGDNDANGRNDVHDTEVLQVNLKSKLTSSTDYPAVSLPYPKVKSSTTPTLGSSARSKYVAQQQRDNTEKHISSNVGWSNHETQGEHDDDVPDGCSSWETVPVIVSVTSTSSSHPLSSSPLSIKEEYTNGDANASQPRPSSSSLKKRLRRVGVTEFIRPEPKILRLGPEAPVKPNRGVTEKKKFESVKAELNEPKQKPVKKFSQSVPKCFQSTSETLASYQFAPRSSIIDPPDIYDFPVQTDAALKESRISNDDMNDDCCFICRDRGDLNDALIYCKKCPRAFHLYCHIPELDDGVLEDDWECNHHTTKEMVDEMIHLTDPDNEEVGYNSNNELVPVNRKEFLLACKFLMECYKIPESPTMRWNFTYGYLRMFGKTPFHLAYIHQRLCLGFVDPSCPFKRFSNVREMLLAFKQMITQALFFYNNNKKETLVRKAAIAFSQKFLLLVEEYYPEEHEVLFEE